MTDALQQLSQFGFSINVTAGKNLFKQGDLAQTMFFIEQGEVLIENNKGSFSKILYDGEHFGELAMVVKNHLRSATATTMQDTSLLVIDKAIYDDVATKHPLLIIEILEELTNTLYNSEQNLLTHNSNASNKEEISLLHSRTIPYQHPPEKGVDYYNITGYKLIKLLGKGSYAEAYLATKNDTGKEFAIKIYDLQEENHESVYEHFFSELEILTELDHPNICKILDYSVTDDYVYTVLKYRDCGTLYDLIAHKPMETHKVFTVFEVIVGALEYLHLNSVIYKDLKSQNILTSSNGDLVLADFGSSNLAIGDKKENTGQVVLSPYYMSPEQSRNHELDYLTDYYSLGILLYEMLTGVKPFIRKSLQDMVKAHRTEKTPRLKNECKVFQRLVDGLTEKSKYDRIQTVAKIRKHLNTITQYWDKYNITSDYKPYS